MDKKKVLISRAASQNKEFRESLEKKGYEVVELPQIKFSIVKDLTEIHKALDQLEKVSWIVFTSARTVEFFFEAAQEYGVKFYFYPDLKIATVGEKTKLKLEQLGYRTNFVPIKYTAKVLVENMDEDLNGKEVLIPRSNLAGNEYLNLLAQRGATPTPLTVYNNEPILYSQIEMKEALSKELNYLTFTSGSTFRAFHENLKNAQLSLNSERIICIGPSTAKVVEDLGYEVFAIAEQHTIEGIINTIENIEQHV